MSRKIDFSKPLSPEDAAYVKQRPWMIEDAELAGFTVTLAETEAEVDDVDDQEDDETNSPDDASPNGDDEEDEEEFDYSELTVKQLKEEIATRNEERDEDDQIEPDSDRKDDLIAALVASDEDSEE